MLPAMPIPIDQKNHQQQAPDAQVSRDEPVGKFVGQCLGAVLREIRLAPEEPSGSQHSLSHQLHRDEKRQQRGGKTERQPERILAPQSQRMPEPRPGRPTVHAEVTGLLSTPSPSISTDTTSPSAIGPTPAGVPVRMTSPGSRVVKEEM